MMRQVEMLRESDTWYSGPFERAPEERFVVMIRAPDDPERRPRGQQKMRWPHLTLKGTREQYRAALLEHLADGCARTWNRTCVEMFDFTADIAPDPFTEAMWSLVDDQFLEITNRAPILIRRRQP